MILSSLTDEELVALVENTWKATDLDKELAQRLYNHLTTACIFQQKFEHLKIKLKELIEDD